MKDLSGKTVLLTGASTGIGPVIARRLRRAGARFVLSARNEAALTKLANELGEARVVVADLSGAGEPERLAREAGGGDILVSNGGGAARGRRGLFAPLEINPGHAPNLRPGLILPPRAPPPVIETQPRHNRFMASAG